MRSSKIYQLEMQILYLKANCFGHGHQHLKTTIIKMDQLKKQIEELRVMDSPKTVGEYYKMMKAKNLM